jgi:hypothetical protein
MRSLGPLKRSRLFRVSFGDIRPVLGSKDRMPLRYVSNHDECDGGLSHGADNHTCW